MDVIGILAKKRQEISAYRIEVSGSQRDEYPQVYSEIVVTHDLEGPGLSEAAVRRAIELSATKYCPVSAMIAAGATTIHHRYRIRTAGSRPRPRKTRSLDRPVPPAGRPRVGSAVLPGRRVAVDGSGARSAVSDSGARAPQVRPPTGPAAHRTLVA